jgi:hypothetical protein
MNYLNGSLADGKSQPLNGSLVDDPTAIRLVLVVIL